jgi:hypothetical protein
MLTICIARIPANFRRFVYCAAVRHGTVKHTDFLRQQYQIETDDVQKSTMSLGLACAKESWILQRYLTEQISIEKCDSAFQVASKKLFGSFITWNYIKENYQLLVEKFVSECLLCSSFVCVLHLYIF